MSSSAFRDKVLEAIRTGRLPESPPECIWAGSGSGAPCVICGQCIEGHEIEFELEFVRGDGRGTRADQRTHRDCFLAWDSERRKVDSRPNALTATDLSSAFGDSILAANEREAQGRQGEE